MAVLANHLTGEKVVLQSYHVFGRRKVGTDTRLESKDVSQVHASIRWEGEEWKVIDHSRNGTWIDQERLIHGKSVSLQQGTLLCFGKAEQSQWKVLETGPPVTVLVPIQEDSTIQEDSAIIELKRFHALPNEENPEISIYISEEGKWIYETEMEIKPLQDGDLIRCGGKLWRFLAAEAIDSTLEEFAQYFPPEEICFSFHVSLDEEHVFLNMSKQNQEVDLGERVHHYLLLTLARQRLQDAKHGNHDDSNQGWVELEKLSKMLNLDFAHINIQIFRARKQVSKALPKALHLPPIIERRIGSVRFGYSSFQIFRGSNLEGKSPSQ